MNNLDSKLDNIFDDILNVKEESNNLIEWEEEPVTFREFLTSKDHLDFPEYSDRQYEAITALFGDDPKNIFFSDTTAFLCILIWGKGCLAGESILEDALTHKKYTIEELYKQNKSILVNSYNEEKQKVEICAASVPWISGKGEIYEVLTETEHKINVFKHHQFYTEKGWQRLSDLKVDDKILNDVLLFEKIKSINYLRKDNYYDLEVDKYHNYLAHGLYNHNSGKDTICCHCILYCIYVLLCVKVPQNMFKGIDSKTVIDILNVASTARQANSIFFTKMKNHVKSWKWLKNKYVIKDSGKKVQKDKKEDENIVSIKGDEIMFPKRIRALSKHSQQEAAEGCSPLLWIADEFDSFSDKNQKSNAMAMYSALETSMRTRYGQQGKGFIISWPRYDGGPIQQLAKLHKNNLRAYIDVAPTFEVKPKRCFVDKWINWHGHEIPEDYLEEFERHPEDSKAKFLCLPPKTSDPFFTELSRIDACIDVNKQPMFTYREKVIDSMNGKLISLEIISRNYNMQDVSFVVAGDIGLSNDLTAVSIWHTETLNLADGTTYNTFVQDCLFKWKPDKSKNIKVDVDNIQTIIDTLINDYKLPINGIIFDHYNSATLLTHYSKKGINAQAYTLKTQDFYDIRAKIYDNKVRFLDDKYQNDEIKRLTNTTSGKPDHLPDEHDDVFRANCLAIVSLSGFKNQSVIVNDDGMFFQKKMTPQLMENSLDNFEPVTVKAKLHTGRSQMDFNPFSDDDYGSFDDEIDFRN